MEEVPTLLRAELAHAGRKFVGHTTVLTPKTSFVRIDEEIELGTPVELELSFRNALRPLHFRAVVTAQRRAAGPGELAGLWLSIDACSAEDAEGLRSLLEATPREREMRVLLVEDSAITREVFVHASRVVKSAIQVDAVTDAERAWTQLQTTPYQLLVVDHFLADSSGADLVARVRAEPATQAIAILGISVGGKVARDAMLSAGADVFLDKPVRVRDLLATLERLSGLVQEGS